MRENKESFVAQPSKTILFQSSKFSAPGHILYADAGDFREGQFRLKILFMRGG